VFLDQDDANAVVARLNPTLIDGEARAGIIDSVCGGRMTQGDSSSRLASRDDFTSGSIFKETQYLYESMSKPRCFLLPITYGIRWRNVTEII
jgi:hypothetical protein